MLHFLQNCKLNKQNNITGLLIRLVLIRCWEYKTIYIRRQFIVQFVPSIFYYILTTHMQEKIGFLSLLFYCSQKYIFYNILYLRRNDLYLSAYTHDMCVIYIFSRKHMGLQFNAGCEWLNRDIILGNNITHWFALAL